MIRLKQEIASVIKVGEASSADGWVEWASWAAEGASGDCGEILWCSGIAILTGTRAWPGTRVVARVWSHSRLLSGNRMVGRSDVDDKQVRRLMEVR